MFLTPEGNLFLNTHDGIHYISSNAILYCKAEGAYTKVFLESETNILICKHLITFERILFEHGFIRVHRSFLVNINKVSFFESKKRVLYIKEIIIPISKRNSGKIYQILLSNGKSDGKNHCCL